MFLIKLEHQWKKGQTNRIIDRCLDLLSDTDKIVFITEWQMSALLHSFCVFHLQKQCLSSEDFIHYRPHPKDGEGTVFTDVCLSRGEVPQSQVLFQVSGPRSFSGRYPSPRFFPWFLVSQVFSRVPPAGTGNPPQLGLGYQTQTPHRTAELVLATRRAVRLLRSRRRTFLFWKIIM